MPQRLVYLASLGHSGSTLFSLLLGGHHRVVSLGEVATTIALWGQSDFPCSCGAAPNDCPIWGPAMAEVAGAALEVAYPAVMRRVDEVYGPTRLVVDASKLPSTLEKIYGFWQGRLDVVFLVRDVRGYVSSTRRFAAGRLGVLGHSALARSAQWYVTNRRIERFVERSGVSSLRLGYEELCLRTQEALTSVGAFLDLPDLTTSGLQQGQAHILQGNKMRYEPGRRDAVEYDHRWFHDVVSEVPWMLWPPLRRYNQTRAYGNLEPRARTPEEPESG